MIEPHKKPHFHQNPGFVFATKKTVTPRAVVISQRTDSPGNTAMLWARPLPSFEFCQRQSYGLATCQVCRAPTLGTFFGSAAARSTELTLGRKITRLFCSSHMISHVYILYIYQVYYYYYHYYYCYHYYIYIPSGYLT